MSEACAFPYFLLLDYLMQQETSVDCFTCSNYYSPNTLFGLCYSTADDRSQMLSSNSQVAKKLTVAICCMKAPSSRFGPEEGFGENQLLLSGVSGFGGLTSQLGSLPVGPVGSRGPRLSRLVFVLAAARLPRADFVGCFKSLGGGCS
ncbi:hypothetical protein JRQ81_005017 [Phrynocephalus forsythii]|uniref:Uncharacterized protein n=1 Tax=Phrynocephalus forsythii TaxID=171643 RepID=A0A9Q0Y3K6_9SAUR|nr:hypothetical protein JRQ81_005017 [Phrynocephalus forsythii]